MLSRDFRVNSEVLSTPLDSNPPMAFRHQFCVEAAWKLFSGSDITNFKGLETGASVGFGLFGVLSPLSHHGGLTIS
jgi:hypothetical protein